MTSSAELPDFLVILLPGLGADKRLFEKLQGLLKHESVVMDWIPTKGDEPLESYVQRLAQTCNSFGSRRYIICGLSFGGVIAPILANYLNAAGCIIISSVRTPVQLPLSYKILFRPFYVMPSLFYITVACIKLLLKYFLNSFLCCKWKSLAEQFLDSDSVWLFQSLRMLLTWSNNSLKTFTSYHFPILQIHGQRDRIIPISNTCPDYVISKGGHVLVDSFSQEISECIDSFLFRCCILEQQVSSVSKLLDSNVGFREKVSDNDIDTNQSFDKID